VIDIPITLSTALEFILFEKMFKNCHYNTEIYENISISKVKLRKLIEI